MVYSVARNIAEKANRVKLKDSIAYYPHKNKITVKNNNNKRTDKSRTFYSIVLILFMKKILQVLLNFRFCMELTGVCACMWCGLILKKVYVLYCLQNS